MLNFPPYCTGAILKWNGSVWSTQDSGITTTLNDVWGADSANIWTVGDAGIILKSNGSVWGAQTSGTAKNLRSVWGTDASNVWAVGDQGTILKWNGINWTEQSISTPFSLVGVWGTDANNVWAVGDYGTILKWNGSVWIPQSIGTTDSLYSVWGTDANNVWVMRGANGAILKWDGTRWSTQNIDATDYLYAAWGTDANNLWFVGSHGTILWKHTNQLVVTLAGNGSGSVTTSPSGIACGDTCTEFSAGSGVRLSANAHAGSSFAGWSGACSGVGQCVVTMDAPKQLTATFIQHEQPAIQTDGQSAAGRPIEFQATLGMNSFDLCTWDFDDDNTSPCQLGITNAEIAAPQNVVVHAAHMYTQPGQYTVTVTASNGAGVVSASLPLTIVADTHSLYMPSITR